MIGHEGGTAKKFEDDIIKLAILSTKHNCEDVASVYERFASDFEAPAKRTATIAAVERLNERFGSIWTEGSNSNYALSAAPMPDYGIKSAKSDIVLNDLPISVKLDTAFVVASAQNKDEFAGIFNSALDLYVAKEGRESDVSELREIVKFLADEYVGEVKTRILPAERKQKVIDKLKGTSLFESLSAHTRSVAGTEVDTYTPATNELKSQLTKLNKLLKINIRIKEYIVWEALSSTLKYNTSEAPAARYVLSPQGIYDISSPDSDYVKKCAKVTKFDIRGLPTGKIRSGTSTFAKYYINQVTDGKDVDVAEMYNEMSQMAFGMKMDVSSSNLKKIHG